MGVVCVCCVAKCVYVLNVCVRVVVGACVRCVCVVAVCGLCVDCVWDVYVRVYVCVVVCVGVAFVRTECLCVEYV